MNIEFHSTQMGPNFSLADLPLRDVNETANQVYRVSTKELIDSYVKLLFFTSIANVPFWLAVSRTKRMIAQFKQRQYKESLKSGLIAGAGFTVSAVTFPYFWEAFLRCNNTQIEHSKERGTYKEVRIF